MSTQVQNIINEWAQGEPLTDENINWLQANANPEVAEFLVSISSGDGKSSIEIRDSIYTDARYNNLVYMTGTDISVQNSKELSK